MPLFGKSSFALSALNRRSALMLTAFSALIVLAVLYALFPWSEGSSRHYLLGVSVYEGDGYRVVAEARLVDKGSGWLVSLASEVARACSSTPICRVDPEYLVEAARFGRAAAVEIAVKVEAKGSILEFGGPGPLCGYSINLNYPEGDPVKVHSKPVTDLYSVEAEEGAVLAGFGGPCQEALIIHRVAVCP